MIDANSEWVSLREAADLLGVHPATVRNWADRGDLPSRRTPGGHRRFRRADLLHYAKTQDEVSKIELQVIIQNALGQARLDVGEGKLARESWYSAMRETTREQLRSQGRRALEGLRQYLASGASSERLADAVAIGRDYAALLAADGLTLPQAVRGFFYFSEFVSNAIITWSELMMPRSPSDWTNLLRQVNGFIHTILLSIIEYYEED
jgi:excisionase family DNA binding protein